MKRVDNFEMKPCYLRKSLYVIPESFYFLETVFEPIKLTRKGTPVPRNFLGAPVYPSPTQYIIPDDTGQASTSAKIINPSTSANHTYAESNPIPLFGTDFQPNDLGYISEEEGSMGGASPTSSTHMLVS